MAIILTKQKNQIEIPLSSRGTIGRIRVNLNWNQSSQTDNIDLDLACLYELSDGKKGVVQALGKKFGDFNSPPFILLDQDDRTGASTEGENLFINGEKIEDIKKILIFTFIYEGVINWTQTDGVVTIEPPSGDKIVINMDEPNNDKRMCALALIENQNEGNISIKRLVEYHKIHHEMDVAYNWGLTWRKGKKD